MCDMIGLLQVWHHFVRVGAGNKTLGAEEQLLLWPLAPSDLADM
jgi:hypothetical protein